MVRVHRLPVVVAVEEDGRLRPGGSQLAEHHRAAAIGGEDFRADAASLHHLLERFGVARDVGHVGSVVGQPEERHQLIHNLGGVRLAIGAHTGQGFRRRVGSFGCKGGRRKNQHKDEPR